MTLAISGNPKSVEIVKINEDIQMPSKGKAKIRFIHLVPNGREVSVFLNGIEAVSEIDYKEVTDYIEVEPGVYQAEIELTQNGKLIRAIKVTVNADRIYTFYAIGNKPNFQIYQSLDGATFLN